MKRKLGDTLRSKTPVAQRNELLLMVPRHSLTCVIQEVHQSEAMALTVPGSLHNSRGGCTRTARSSVVPVQSRLDDVRRGRCAHQVRGVFNSRDLVARLV
jgi:hypothetical protein